MSIFISHSSKDKSIIQQFVDKILKEGCGLNDHQIFCTSVEGSGINTGEDFRERIKSELQTAKYSFIMISENYKRSEVCLNEMGASWGLNELKVRQYLFPNLTFNSLGLLMNTQQGAKLDKSCDLDKIHQELSSDYQVNVPIDIWKKNKSDFLDILDTYSRYSSNRIFPSPDEYFNSFVQENASLNHILLKSHPTLLDCKRIFSEKYYRQFFKYYSQQFEVIEKEYTTPLFPKKKHFRYNKINSSQFGDLNSKVSEGMIDLIRSGYLIFSIDLYEVRFLENEYSECSERYSYFCYVNDRWVFIPKPWRFLKQIN
jgi:hypothetical protein